MDVYRARLEVAKKSLQSSAVTDCKECKAARSSVHSRVVIAAFSKLAKSLDEAEVAIMVEDLMEVEWSDADREMIVNCLLRLTRPCLGVRKKGGQRQDYLAVVDMWAADGWDDLEHSNVDKLVVKVSPLFGCSLPQACNEDLVRFTLEAT